MSESMRLVIVAETRIDTSDTVHGIHEAVETINAAVRHALHDQPFLVHLAIRDVADDVLAVFTPPGVTRRH